MGCREGRVAALCRKRQLCRYGLARRLGVSEGDGQGHHPGRGQRPPPSPSLRVRLARVLSVGERELE
jgi:hypothetical protein